MELLAIADDLTGALETGAQLADQGIPAPVFTRPSDVRRPAAVVNANTRHLAPDAAAAIVRTVLKPATNIFLKTDSTLRGPIPASIAALVQAFPNRTVLYAPAYPAVGRTVKHGRLFVSGIPLEQTEFTRDLLNPVQTGSIPGMLSSAFDPRCICTGAPEGVNELLRRPECQVVVCDGQIDADLDEAAQQMRAAGLPVIAAGTAGFVGPWAKTLTLSRHAPPPRPQSRSGLIVVGSRHPRSRTQVCEAAVRGIPTAVLDAEHPIEYFVDRIAECSWTVLTTPETPSGEPLHMAKCCGESIRTILSRTTLDALVVFGGDTALAITDALGSTVAFPYGELLPGIPVSRIDSVRSYTLVTKAGAFGGEHVIENILERLKGER